MTQPDQAEPPIIADPHGHFWEGIQLLKPRGPIEETSFGRLNGIYMDEYLVYHEMYLLLNQPRTLPPAEYEERLRDCLDQLLGLQRRGDKEWEAIQAAGWAW